MATILQTNRTRRVAGYRSDGLGQRPAVQLGQHEGCEQQAAGHVVGRENVEQVGLRQFGGRDITGVRTTLDHVRSAHDDGHAVLTRRLRRSDGGGEFRHGHAFAKCRFDIRDQRIVMASQRQLQGPAGLDNRSPVRNGERLLVGAALGNDRIKLGVAEALVALGIAPKADQIAPLALSGRVVHHTNMKNMNPGPFLFTNNPQNIYAVFLIFIIANIIMIPLGILCIKVARRILKVPRNILMPAILMFCVVGTFAINNDLFSIGVMLVAGLLAYVFEDNDFPIAPAILGVVLGSMLEENFITSMIKSDGNLGAFFSRPIAAVLAGFTIVIWLSPPLLVLLRKIRASATATP